MFSTFKDSVKRRLKRFTMIIKNATKQFMTQIKPIIRHVTFSLNCLQREPTRHFRSDALKCVSLEINYIHSCVTKHNHRQLARANGPSTHIASTQHFLHITFSKQNKTDK